jgi:dolichyl-phosphate beta-glucosyltransferase
VSGHPTVTVSIIIPAYNESLRLANGFERLRPILEQLGLTSTEVIIVDDGSSDDTLHVAHEIYGHLPERLFVQQPHNIGKGAAVRLGIALARGEMVIVADADMAIRPAYFPLILEALANAPLAPGSRTSQGRINYDSALRTVAGGIFHRLVRHYAGTKVRDTQCGCKGFRLGPARLLALMGMVNRFAYDAEMFYLAEQLGLVVTPVTVQWDDIEGSSVNVSRTSLNVLSDLRHLSRTRYENPVIELDPGVDATTVRDASRQARLQGLVLARGADFDMLVLPRDGALGGLSVAAALDGHLRTAELHEFRDRLLEAV